MIARVGSGSVGLNAESRQLPLGPTTASGRGPARRGIDTDNFLGRSRIVSATTSPTDKRPRLMTMFRSRSIPTRSRPRLASATSIPTDATGTRLSAFAASAGATTWMSSGLAPAGISMGLVPADSSGGRVSGRKYRVSCVPGQPPRAWSGHPDASRPPHSPSPHSRSARIFLRCSSSSRPIARAYTDGGAGRQPSDVGRIVRPSVQTCLAHRMETRSAPAGVAGSFRPTCLRSSPAPEVPPGVGR